MIRRCLRHLFAPSAARLFPRPVLERIAAAVAEGESRHTGEVCFAVESSLPLRAVLAGADVRAQAEAAFARLRVWDTEANNGVLLYLLLAERRIEIVADRGLAARVPPAQWQEACRRMEARLRAGEPEAAALEGVAAVSALVERHFPRGEGAPSANELPDLPHLS